MNARSWHIVIVSTLAIILAPTLFSLGVFMDGGIYSCVALNLYQGIGNFSDPSFTPGLATHFHGHPPLAMWIQSLWMHLVGTSPYADRWFSIIIMGMQGLAIIWLWNKIHPGQKKLSFLPLFIWVLTPVIFWAFPNNMLENSMGIFTLLSVGTAVTALEKDSVFQAAVSGLLLLAGWYIKGPVALFPAGVFFIDAWSKKKWFTRQTWKLSLVQWGTFALIFSSILWIFPLEKEAWITYWDIQVVHSIEKINTVHSRFYLAYQSILEILPALALLFILHRFVFKIKETLRFSSKAIFLWILAFSAVIPMLVSMKQREFYLIPAMSFMALALATMFSSVGQLALDWSQNQGRSWLVGLSLSFFSAAAVIAWNNKGTPYRDQTMHQDLVQLNQLCDKLHEKNIAVDDNMLFQEWSMQAYAYRYYGIYFTFPADFKATCIITGVGDRRKDLKPKGYHLIATLNHFQVWKKSSIEP
jgi:hypothetical protein